MAQLAGLANNGSDNRRFWLAPLICASCLGLELFTLFHDVEPDARHARPSHEVPIATFLSGRNDVRHKVAGTIIWGVPTPGSLLLAEDVVATMPDADARVAFTDSSELQIEPGSFIVFEKNPVLGASGGLARIVRGTIARRKSSTAPLYVRTSSNPAVPPLRIDDARADSVFRVSRGEKGVEVVVERGSVTLNQGRSIAKGEKVLVAADQKSLEEQELPITLPSPKPPQLLPAPKLKKPTLKIESPGASVFQWLAEVFWESTVLAGQAPRITIGFEWEPVADAKAYRLQVALDPDFKRLLLDRHVEQAHYTFRSQSGKIRDAVYFRVATIDDQDTTGSFSEAEAIQLKISLTDSETNSESGPDMDTEPNPTANTQLNTDSKSATSPSRQLNVGVYPPLTLAPTATPSPKISSTEARAQSVSSTPTRSAPPTPLSAPPIESTPTWFLDLSYGFSFQSRTFKNSEIPAIATGSGFIANRLRAEGKKQLLAGQNLTLELSYLPELVRPSHPIVDLGILRVPLVKIQPTWQRSVGDWQLGGGIRVATSQRLAWSDSRLQSTFRWIAAPVFRVSQIHNTSQLASWSAEIAPYGIGSLGLEFDSRVQTHLQRFAPAWSKSKPWTSNLFVALEFDARWISIEESYGGCFDAGYSF